MPIADMEKWKSKQIQAAIERGVHPLDAAQAMENFLASLPVGADPATYVRPDWSLDEDISSEAIEADARAAWYGSDTVPPSFKRLLDATSID